MNPTELRQPLMEAEKILCISHVNPDGDAFGSLLGMGHILARMGKQPTLSLQDDVLPHFVFLPGADTIVGPDQVDADYDLIVVLDASSQDRMGRVFRPADHGHIPMMVIDHHVTNTYFGQINWVDPTCAATCQMLIYLADALGIELDGDLAVCLLTGLVTDTLCFRTDGTDARVMEAGMRLMQGGARLADITARTVNRQAYRTFNLWGEVFPSIRLEEGVIWACLRIADFEAANAPVGEDGSLSGKLIMADEADVSATFIEKINDAGQHVVECSFRAKTGFDVAQLALSYGGGGHPPAAGCTIVGPFDEVVAQVVADLKSTRGVQSAARNGQVRV
jgi:phosphoesterase RecJ-like protein